MGVPIRDYKKIQIILPISVDTGKCSFLLATPDFEAYFSVFAKLGEEKKQSLFLKNDCFLLVLV